MKRILHILLLLLAVFPAFADDVSLGYCDGGQVESSFSGASEVAVLFTAADFPMYAGSTITGIRIGVNSDVPAGVTVFLRSSLTGANIFSERTPALYKGWNDITFSKTVDYPAGDLYVGYETNNSILVGVSGTVTSNSCWVSDGQTWTDYSKQGQQPLSIELLIDGTSYTKKDIGLVSADDATFARNTEFTISGVLRNNTNEVLTSARLACDYGNGPVEADAKVDEVLPGESGTFSLPLSGIPTIGDYTAKLTVVSINGAPDEYAFNDTTECNLHVIGELSSHKVLIEEFTGQACPNCPSGAALLAEGLKGKDNYVMVSHHTGFGDDTMTCDGLDYLHYFYNEGGTTYAPAVMIDRHYCGSYGVPGLDNHVAPGPIFAISSSAAISTIFGDQASQPAKVNVSIARNYNPSTRELTVRVGMKQVDGMELGNNPVLTVLVTEDSIIAAQRPDYPNYVHRHVTRGFLTAALGDPVKLSTADSTYATYKLNVNSSWVASRMQIVAFVSNYDNTDCNNCDVYNTEACSLIGNDDVTTAIDRVSESHSAEVEAVYSLAGVRIDKPQHGINIVKFKDGTTRKVIVR